MLTFCFLYYQNKLRTFFWKTPQSLFQLSILTFNSLIQNFHIRYTRIQLSLKIWLRRWEILDTLWNFELMTLESIPLHDAAFCQNMSILFFVASIKNNEVHHMAVSYPAGFSSLVPWGPIYGRALTVVIT